MARGLTFYSHSECLQPTCALCRWHGRPTTFASRCGVGLGSQRPPFPLAPRVGDMGHPSPVESETGMCSEMAEPMPLAFPLPVPWIPSPGVSPRAEVRDGGGSPHGVLPLPNWLQGIMSWAFGVACCVQCLLTQVRDLTRHLCPDGRSGTSPV